MNRLMRVLLIEDNPADADLTRETLERSKLCLDIVVASDGDDALEMLHRRGPHADAAPPDLILLDLNLPRRNGREVLSAIRTSPTLRRIPVVILTSSDADQDIARSYELGANCYVTKPVDLASFQSIVQSVEQFWFTVVKLPSAEAAEESRG